MHAFVACGQDHCTYTAESDPFLDAGVQVGVFPQEDCEMGGTQEAHVVRGFAAPVETSCFYSRLGGRVKGKAPVRAPVRTLVRPAPGGGVRKTQRKGKEGHAGRKGREAVKKASKGLGTMGRRGI